MGPLPRGYILLSKHLSGKMVTLPGYSYPMHSARTALGRNVRSSPQRLRNHVIEQIVAITNLYITLKTDVFKGIFSHHHTFLQYTIHSVIYKTSHLKDT